MLANYFRCRRAFRCRDHSTHTQTQARTHVECIRILRTGGRGVRVVSVVFGGWHSHAIVRQEQLVRGRLSSSANTRTLQHHSASCSTPSSAVSSRERSISATTSTPSRSTSHTRPVAVVSPRIVHAPPVWVAS